MIKLIDKNMFGTIYMITNTITNQIYIGQTTQNIDKYWGSGVYLRRALRKYGRKHFVKVSLCVCASQQELDDKEQLYIKQYNCLHPVGYNLDLGGSGIGKRSIEWVEKMRKINIGSKRNDVSKKLMSDIQKRMIREGKQLPNQKGNKLSTEVKEKISKTLKGTKHSKETIAKMSDGRRKGRNHPKYGIPMPISLKQKLIELHTGVNNHNYGKPLSDEYKKKISEAKIGVKQTLLTCPHCGKIGGISSIKRWHFANCKKFEIIT